jgi:hypothetical protein
MDALDEWNSLTPGWYNVEFMNDKKAAIPVKRFIHSASGGVIYMIDIDDAVYNWNNVMRVTKTAEL